jgi:hypothetical protein
MLLLALLLAVGCAGGSADDPSKANSVLLITVEGLDASASGATLDGFVQYGDVMTTSPQIRPAAASVLTGLGADRHGAEDDHSGVLSSEVGTLAELLAGQGRSTAAFLGNPQLGRRSGLDRGFEIYDVPPMPTVLGPLRFFPVMRSPDAVAANVVAWLESQAGPFFAWVHLVGPGPGVIYGEGGRPSPQQPEGASWSAAVDAILGAVGAREDGGATAVLLAGLGVRPRADDAERSGYFLVPDVLRVPLWLRPVDGTQAPDPSLPWWTPDLAAWMIGQASVEASLGEGSSTSDPGRARHAWTWRGARELGWYPETAVLREGVLVTREGRSGPLRSMDWASGYGVPDEPAMDVLALLQARAVPEEARLSPVVELPQALSDELAGLGVSMTSDSAGAEVAARAVRVQALAKLLEARGVVVFEGSRPRALEVYRFALSLDPGNRGARQDLAEILVNRPARARAHVDAILADDPYNPDGWHAFGHLAHREENYELADALWRLTVLLRPGDGDLLYDLACTKSLLADLDASIDYLERAWEAGFRSVDYIEADADLRNLREDERFARFMSRVVR